MRNSLNGTARLIATLAAVALAANLVPSPAWAFWFGTIPADNVVLKETPRENSRTLETLSQGARFTAADQAVDGYYRVRTKTNTGYIDATLIDSQNPKQNAAAGSPAPAPTEAASPPVTQTQPTSSRRSRSRSAPKKDEEGKWSVSLLAGATLSNPSQVSSAIGSKSLSDPLGLGVELGYRIAESWRLAFRGDYLAKGLTGTNSGANTDTYQLTMKGYMFMLGADGFLANTPKYDIFVLARVGLGLGKLSSVDTSQASPNETDFSAVTFAGNFGLGADYKAWSFLWFGLEAGYQVFTTGSTSPSYPSTGSTNTIWPNPISLSYSGFYMDANLRIVF